MWALAFSQGSSHFTLSGHKTVTTSFIHPVIEQNVLDSAYLPPAVLHSKLLGDCALPLPNPQHCLCGAWASGQILQGRSQLESSCY